jgi:hypothetical protein
MIFLAAIAAAVQVSGGTPPAVVAVNRLPISPIARVNWACRASSASGTALVISGDFPAISTDDQKNGAAYRIKSEVKSSLPELGGTFPAAMTFNLVGMTNYSISIPNSTSKISSYVLNFDFFSKSQDGFIKIAHFDPVTGAPSAFAAGLCKVQVIQ